MLRSATAWAFAAFACLAVQLSMVSCSDARTKEAGGRKASPAIGKVANYAHFKKLVQASGSRLLLFEFYADWCAPCRLLEPVLRDLADKYRDKAAVFKVDIDFNRDLAMDVGVRGVPFVLFVKNGKAVHSLMGLQSKEAYERAVIRFGDAAASGSPDTDTDIPDGRLVRGERVIHRSTISPLDSMYVYRGELVRLIIEDITFPYAIHIPAFGVSEKAGPGTRLEVRFKAVDTGVYPVFCNGKCPVGDGEQLGRIIVMPYRGEAGSSYQELAASEAMSLIRTRDPLIIDVRTPGEYYAGHLEGARLIPLQQLQERVGEIAGEKGRDILLYCRSGNRSTVAAEILGRAGFKKLYNIRYGILEWEKEGHRVVQ
jgi:thioredoxin